MCEEEEDRYCCCTATTNRGRDRRQRQRKQMGKTIGRRSKSARRRQQLAAQHVMKGASQLAQTFWSSVQTHRLQPQVITGSVFVDTFATHENFWTNQVEAVFTDVFHFEGIQGRQIFAIVLSFLQEELWTQPDIKLRIWKSLDEIGHQQFLKQRYVYDLKRLFLLTTVGQPDISALEERYKDWKVSDAWLVHKYLGTYFLFWCVVCPLVKWLGVLVESVVFCYLASKATVRAHRLPTPCVVAIMALGVPYNLLSYYLIVWPSCVACVLRAALGELLYHAQVVSADTYWLQRRINAGNHWENTKELIEKWRWDGILDLCCKFLAQREYLQRVLRWCFG